MKKSQAALEYVLILGLILVAVVTLFTYSSTKSINTSRINQAYEAVQTIQQAATHVYNIGPGAREYVEIKIPSGVNNFSTKDNQINLNLSIYGSQSNIHSSSPVIINGTLPYKEGIYHVMVEMRQDYILIGTTGFPVSTITTTTLSGSSFQGCYLSNNCGTDLKLFKVSYTSNAHAGVLTSSYNYYVCCRGSDIDNKCNGKYDEVIKLSSNSNAHVQIPAVASYPINICLSTTSGNNVNCVDMGTPCSMMPVSYKCMFKISSSTNAHIADCSSPISWFYICCEVT